MAERTRHGGEGVGRTAERPADIPRRGWRQALVRVKNETSRDNLSIVAGGVAFYLILALFPALFAAVSIYGLVASPGSIEQQVSNLEGTVPASALDIVRGQLSDLTRQSPGALGWGAALSILLAVWSASKGVKAMMEGLNIAYDERESRGFLKLQAVALLLTLGFIVFGVVALGLIAILPGVLGSLGLSAATQGVVLVVQYLLLLAIVVVGLAALYRFAPDRKKPQWRWVSPGSAVASLLWIVASLLFTWYAASFGSFNKTYGAIAGGFIIGIATEVSTMFIAPVYKPAVAFALIVVLLIVRPTGLMGGR